MKKTLLLAVTATLLASAASAGPIERACLTSERRAANRSLCGCIGHVADQTLSGAEQRMAAKFFKDPEKAQQIRQSDSQSHEVFWQRYKAFGATAQQTCS